MIKQTSIKEEILRHPVNKPLSASKLYQEKFSTEMTELAFYKAIERLNASKFIVKIAKGVYCRPKITKYGTILPSEREIVGLYTERKQGTIAGYSLYNALNLTTQIAKKHEVYSSQIEQQTKTIGNVVIKQYPLEYSREVTDTIHIMEVLQHYNEIQDLNTRQFINLCEKYRTQYNEEAFANVMKTIRYQKSTVAFLKDILDHYNVPNSLNKYLSAFSKYKHPQMEAIYETAYLQ